MPRLLLLFSAFLLLAPLPFTISRATAAEPNLAIAAEIDALTIAVNRLAVALEEAQQTEKYKESREKLNQAIAYLSFRSRRIEMLERDVAAAKNLRSYTDEALKALNDRLRDLEERQRQNPKEGSDELAREIEDAKSQRTMYKDRQSRRDDEILQLENRIYELQNEINKIESFVQRNLEF